MEVSKTLFCHLKLQWTHERISSKCTENFGTRPRKGSPALLYLSPHLTVKHPSLSSSFNERPRVTQLFLQTVWRKVTDMLPLLSRDPRYRIPIAVVLKKQEASCISTWAVHFSGRICKLIAAILCCDCQRMGLQGQRQSVG